MFTSRAEHRLLLRIDNADLRLTPRGRDIGLVDDEQWQHFCARRDRYRRNISILETTMVRSEKGERMPASELLRRPSVRLEPMVMGKEVQLSLEGSSRPLDIASLENEVKYAGYLRREQSSADRLKRRERTRIPTGLAFSGVPGLSREVVFRLTQVRPETLGQAARIPGVTHAAVAVLGAFIEKSQSHRGHE
jgi:tRNA uridine 5-carboxymethylaminomethyl modification enzyme